MPTNHLTISWQTLIDAGQCPACLAAGVNNGIVWKITSIRPRIDTPVCKVCKTEYREYSKTELD